jgi:hypothetical protein
VIPRLAALVLLLLALVLAALGLSGRLDARTIDEPHCPVCERTATWPNLPMVLADEDGTFRGAVYPRQRVFVCDRDGTVFVGQWAGEREGE